jgi:amino acid adenylation domain-containing protein
MFPDLSFLILVVGDLLLEKGLKAGDRVVVLQRKSIESITVILALEECGITYIPLDPDSPVKRIQSILDDCKPTAIIADKELLPAHLKCDLEISSLINGMGSTCISFFNAPSNDKFAYVLYTSGSTGIPKGVCVSAEAAAKFVDWGTSAFSIDSKSVVASIAPFHFDLSVLDIYSLAKGASLHVFTSEEVKNPRLVAEQLVASKTTTIYATPTFFMALLEFGKIEKYDWQHLKTVLFAGEVFPVKQLHALMSIWNDVRFFNLYGPTETNVCAFSQIIRDDTRTEPYPIGQPCPEHQIAISDEGELLVGGAHVANEYLNRPELTAEKFFTRNNVRWFRTGDRVGQDESGNLIYKGRIDRMVKRRGYRIEPGEIENALHKLEGIHGAAVISRMENETVLLVAVVITDKNRSVDIIQLKSELISVLPGYMLPDSVVTVPEFPKTSSGKIDYVKLQAEVVSSL